MGPLVEVPVTRVLPPTTAVAVAQAPPVAFAVTLKVGVMSGSNKSVKVAMPAVADTVMPTGRLSRKAAVR